ncbi:serpin family protein [Bacillus sp. FJAT-29790]|uniref:serpin family protein n=1 Tax=Bacillus sp. FJAT-29790 TaxID=1895002 RepID=UPI0020B30B9C|nr:serpin family protein [Bacillus sp. FJAT-29790]
MATFVEVVKESASIDTPFHMEVNRPFFIVITDNETSTILFMVQFPIYRKIELYSR